MTAGTPAKKIGQAYDTQYTVSQGLTLGNQYKLYVCVDGQGLVDRTTNTATVQILGKQYPPGDIVSFSAAWDAVYRAVNFNWTAVDDIDLDRYEIQEGATWADGASPVYVGKKGETAGAIYLQEGTNENKVYCIKAVDTSGIYSDAEAVSDPVLINTSACALVTPGGLTLSSTSSITTDGRNIVTLTATWNADAEASDAWHHYNLKKEDIATGAKSAFATQGREYTWTVMPNKEYGVSVQAEDISGNTTAWSAQVTHTTTKDNDAPAAPTWPTSQAAIPGFKVIGLSWNDNTEYDLSHYILERSTSSNFGSNVTVLGEIRASFYADANGLDVSETYYYRLKAVDTSGNQSDYSAIKSATTTQVGSTDIAYNAIIANHISVSDLSAISANMGTLTAGRIQSPDNTTYLDLNNNLMSLGNKLSWDGISLVFSDIHHPDDTTMIDGGRIYAGSTIRIGNVDGTGDYCLINDGDISFYKYDNGEHYEYKSLRRWEAGRAYADGQTPVKLPGLWSAPPHVIVSAASAFVYSKEASNLDQELHCDSGATELQPGESKKYQFIPSMTLERKGDIFAYEDIPVTTPEAEFPGKRKDRFYSYATDLENQDVNKLFIRAKVTSAVALVKAGSGNWEVSSHRGSHFRAHLQLYISGSWQTVWTGPWRTPNTQYGHNNYQLPLIQKTDNNFIHRYRFAWQWWRGSWGNYPTRRQVTAIVQTRYEHVKTTTIVSRGYVNWMAIGE